jgi:predicted ATP-grasp superfamily ATP-dependent carboligase
MPDATASTRAHVVIAGVSTRAMAESAARAGYRVTAVDAFGDLDQHPGVRALSLPRDFGARFSATAAARAATEIACDAVAYLSPFENHPSAVRRLAQRAMLWGNSPAVLRRTRDPRRFATMLEQDTVSAKATRWLLKPRASGGGHGIRWWVPGDPVPSNAHVQPFVDGTPGSIVFVAAHGAAVTLGVTRQIIGDRAFGADGFRYCGSILAPARDRHLGDSSRLMISATELVATVARELDLVGVNCIDFIARDGIPVPIELNPRWSASMELVERVYGVSVFGMHADACSNGLLPTFDLAYVSARHRATARAIVFARHDVVCGDTRAWLDDATVRDVPHPGEHIRAGRPVCTVFADGADSASCYTSCVLRAERVYELLESWSSVPA